MEFILFRLIQLMKRELTVINDLQLCVKKYNKGEKGPTELLEIVNMEKQLARAIKKMDLDKQEECNALARLLSLPQKKWPLRKILARLHSTLDGSNFLLEELYNDLTVLIKEAKVQKKLTQRLFIIENFFTIPNITVIDSFDTIGMTKMQEYVDSKGGTEVVKIK